MAVQDSIVQPEMEGGRPSILVRAGNAVRSGLALILKTNTGRVAFAIVLIHLLVAILGPWITPYPPTEYNLPERFSGPTAENWLGTDDKGRDVLSRVLAGSRSIVWIATVGTILGVTLGTIVGVTSGYFGGKTDQVIMRFVGLVPRHSVPAARHTRHQHEQTEIQRPRRVMARNTHDWHILHAQQQPRHSQRRPRDQAAGVRAEREAQRRANDIHHVPRDTAECSPRSRGRSRDTPEFRTAAYGWTRLLGTGCSAAVIGLGLDGQRELPPYRAGAARGARSGHGHGVARGRHKPARGRHQASAESARNRRLIDARWTERRRAANSD